MKNDNVIKEFTAAEIFYFYNILSYLNTEYDKKNKIEEDLPYWYEISENGSVKFKEGLLAENLIKNEKSFYCGGRFYFYDNGVYSEVEKEKAYSKIKSYCIPEYLRSSHLDNTYNLWKVDVLQRPENINKNPYILNLKNGLLDVKTMEFKEHTCEYFSTVQLNTNYNPSLKIEYAKLFNEFLEKRIPNKDTQKQAQEMAGYTLLNIPPEKLFMLTGQTNTGKSTFLDIIQFLIGEKNYSNIPLQNLGDRFLKIRMFNKLANICGDIPSTALKELSTIKQLTSGGDRIEAEYKGIDSFSFVNKATPIFSCNELPENESEKNEAFYNRLIVLSFNNRVPNTEVDPNYKQKLFEEIDYIFLWVLEGLQRLIENNFQFTQSEESLEIKDKYKTKSNNVKQYIKECVEFVEDGFTSHKNMFQGYASYCEECRIKNQFILNKSQFEEELKKLTQLEQKPCKINGKTIRGYKGIILRNEDEESE